MPIDNERFKQLLISWPEKAFALLYENYYVNLRNAAEWQTHNQRIAEDIVQEVFAELWKSRSKISAIENLSIEPYLFTVVKNKAMRTDLQNKRANENFQQYLHEIKKNVSEPGEAAKEEHERRIWKAIDTFPRSERECLTLKYKHQMSNEAIAGYLAVTVKAVERSITSAYKRLRKRKDIGR